MSDETKARLVDQRGVPIPRPDIGMQGLTSGSMSIGYGAATMGTSGYWPRPVASASPLVIPQASPKPRPRRRVLLTQGWTRPHIDTGLHYGEPKQEAP